MATIRNLLPDAVAATSAVMIEEGSKAIQAALGQLKQRRRRAASA